MEEQAMVLTKHRVDVGVFHRRNDGSADDDTLPVEFEGEQVAIYDRKDTDGTRGTKQKLFRLPDGRYVAHVENWSAWQGESDSYELFAVQEADLHPGGKWEHLGFAAGMWASLPLKEALKRSGGHVDV